MLGFRMRVFNRFKITRRAAYVIVELGFAISEDKDDLGEQVESFTIPLTSSANLAVDLFKATIESSVDLTEYFVQFASRVAELNLTSQDAEAKKAAIAAKFEATQEPKKDA